MRVYLFIYFLTNIYARLQSKKKKKLRVILFAKQSFPCTKILIKKKTPPKYSNGITGGLSIRIERESIF